MTLLSHRIQQPIGRAPTRARWGIPGYILVYLGAVTLMGLFHIAVLDADSVCVLLAVTAVGVSVIPAIFFGWRDLPALITLVAGARYASSAIIWKTLELDAIDHGLYAAEKSFEVVLIGVIAVTLGALVAHMLWRRRPLFRESYSPTGLSVLTIIALAAAVITVLIQALKLDVLGGIRTLLVEGLAMFPIAWLALNLQFRGRPFSLWFWVVTSLVVLSSLALNARSSTGVIFLAIAAALACFRVRVGKSIAILGIVFALFFSFIVAPAMVDARRYRGDETGLSMTDFVLLTMEQIERRMTGEVGNDPTEPVQNYYLKYLRMQNRFLERLVNVQQLDYIVALAADEGTIGYERLWDSLIALMPAALVEDKSILKADYALWAYGALEVGFETYVEVTTFGDAYVQGGATFLFVSIFAAFTLFFLYCRAFCPRFDNSIFAAFIFTAYIHMLTAAHLIVIISIFLRTLPFELLLFWVVSRIGRGGTRRGIAA